MKKKSFYIKSTIAVFGSAIVVLGFVSGFQKGKNNAPFTTVKVEGGAISGIESNNGASHIFKGIPFAAPPIGALRWKAPMPVQSWIGVKVCDTFGPSPMQGAPAPFSMWSQEFLIPKKPISEDCLYLNVWTGASSPKAKLPVLVWIYGGGFVSGGSGAPIYDGEAMAGKGIVFVSINYRVGIFGFFAHPQLSQEAPYHASGNYALLDQVAALQWVKNNITAFGGDANNVTIAGQSAGSMSVNCLMASPLAKNMFQKAIGESGAGFTRQYPTLAKAEEAGEQIMQLLGDTGISQMRAMPEEELMQKAKGHYGPVTDGYFLPDAIATIFKKGEENKVPLLTGWNEDEIMISPVKNAADYKKQIEETYGDNASEILRFYPAGTDAEAATSQQRLARDIQFGIQNYTWANVESSHGLPVYVYRFGRRLPATGAYKKYGAFHTGEVPYAYDNLKFVDRPWEPVDRVLANTMSSYWTNFVKNGNPNGRGLPAWPRYTTESKEIIVLDKNVESKAIPHKDRLDFLYELLGGR